MIDGVGVLPSTGDPVARSRARELGSQFSGNTGSMVFDDALEAWLPHAFSVRSHSFLDLAEYSHLVISLANLVSPVPPEPSLVALHKRLARATARNPELRIVVAAVGSQFDSMESACTIHPERLRILRDLASWAPFLGVRGHFTEALLQQEGIDNTWVIGDPALTHPRISNGQRSSKSRHGAVVGWTPTGKYRDKLVQLLRWAARLDLTYVAQSKTEYLNRRPSDSRVVATRGLVPLIRYYSWNSELLTEEIVSWMTRRGFAFGAAEEWYTAIARSVVSVGTRYHGNAAAVIAGVPALQLVLDSRTQEMASFHGLPSVSLSEFDSEWSIEDVLELADMDPFFRRLPSVRLNLHDFLQSCGVRVPRTQPRQRGTGDILPSEGALRTLTPGEQARIRTLQTHVEGWDGQAPSLAELRQLAWHLQRLRGDTHAQLVEFGPALEYGLRRAGEADLVTELAEALGRPL